MCAGHLDTFACKSPDVCKKKTKDANGFFVRRLQFATLLAKQMKFLAQKEWTSMDVRNPMYAYPWEETTTEGYAIPIALIYVMRMKYCVQVILTLMMGARKLIFVYIRE